ncbi:MAG: endonuclease/exonuclease/phosphatase family protein [Bacillota bacterium]
MPLDFPLRVLTYNIRHCKGLDGKVSLCRVAAVIRSAGADLVALQEVDAFSSRSGFRHQAAALGRQLNMWSVYGPTRKTFKLAQFGNAILGKWNLAETFQHKLPGRGEARGLLGVTVTGNGMKVNFVTTHLGLDEKDREEQVGKIVEVLRDTTMPFIFCGDFNCHPGAGELVPLYSLARDAAEVFGTDAPTFPAGRPGARIDYVFISSHWSVLSVEVLETDASDHLPVLAKLEPTAGSY